MVMIRTVATRPRINPTPRTATLFRCLLRRLLREASYLPDPVARKYHHWYIVGRFRDYNPEPLEFPLPFHIPTKPLRGLIHQSELLYDCRRYLTRLHKAATGDVKVLRTILLHAYGRVGKRKHELLGQYLPPDAPSTPEELEEAMAASTSRRLQLSDSMRSLMTAQQREVNGTVGKNKGNMRRFFQDVLPEENIWGRPMPRKRIYNKKLKEWGTLIEKLYPPLPPKQFQRLQDLAAGKIPCPPIPKRRIMAGSETKLPKIGARHKIDQQTMQRLWADILTLCSTTEDRGDDKQRIVWGKSIEYGIDRFHIKEYEQDLFANTIRP